MQSVIQKTLLFSTLFLLLNVHLFFCSPNLALDFGDNPTYGAFDCGNSSEFATIYQELTIEAWIAPRWNMDFNESWSSKFLQMFST